MIVGVADTHAALWLLFGDPRLSASAKSFFDYAAEEGLKIALSSISLVEVVYLSEKKRLPAQALKDLIDAIKDPDHIFEEVFLSSEIAAAIKQIPREAVPDMPDRILAATAFYLGVPVISRDRRIRAANVRAIW